MPDNTINFSAHPVAEHRPPPLVSEHAEAILAEFGVSPAERERIQRAGTSAA